jgi:excisionase family DNA binding protein
MYLTIKQAAEMLGVSRKTIDRRIADGSLKAYHLSKRAVRIDPKDLCAFVERGVRIDSHEDERGSR